MNTEHTPGENPVEFWKRVATVRGQRVLEVEYQRDQLLAALRTLLEAVEADANFDPHTPHTLAIDAARAAIDKAVQS